MKRSAGVLLRRPSGEVLLVHPGGPFWARKDLGAWSIPKGEYTDGESAEVAARREFLEELGVEAPPSLTDLGTVRQKNGKEVRAFLGEGDLDVGNVVSNTFEMEWPPRSGRMASFPEIDRAEWFSLDVAREKLNPAQAELLDRLPPTLNPSG
jgi:predicted NUDIX family NTP pyrophosphohydrolase